jgi:hypothetical protein
MTDRAGGGLTAAIADELAACRQRGIERVDVRSHSQVPVQTPELDHLADDYLTARQLRVQGRVARLKYLLRDAARAFVAENATDAQLVSALFFGDSQNRVTKSAGELLDVARKDSGYVSEVRFRQARHDAFNSFASFIPAFVAAAVPEGEEAAAPEIAPPSLAEDHSLPQEQVEREGSVPDPEVQRHVATTGYIDNGEHFIDLLAQAASATIVGFTNETLATSLRAALERKRAAMLKPDVYWDSIRIVFLGDELLDLINDERREQPDPDEAVQRRRRAKVHGRRTIGNFLRGHPAAAHWEIYDSPYFPSLFGTLFEMPNGQRIVQQLIRRSQRNNLDHLYLELDDTRGHYFSAVFEEIVRSSIDDNKLVPVGNVIGERFWVTSTRYRLSLLVDGSQAAGWIALILVITWRVRNGQAEPLLQLRTQLNSVRELDRLSHPASHVILDEPAQPVTDFGLDDEMPVAAARRRVQIDTGEGEPGELKPLGTCTYIHSDKEHLFFFIYTCELPEGFQFWRQADMYSVPVRKLLSIRENQAFRKALSLCESPPPLRRVRAVAFEIAALNVMLHGHPEIAQKLRRAGTQRGTNIDELADDLRDLEEQTGQAWTGFEKEVQVKGLSGLQYREFFTILLPFYAEVGMPGAVEMLTRLNNDETMRAAVARLAELYHDVTLMESIPFEL